ncbi:unnamed protein product [Notodromas monacha]|uniref:Uncharacterized protein n=1 Tax=Notodromas monacha TaxID=399045 RepID=A0A7R9C2H1_9CRUS|nr:unnamed protein product [Notodromas monacha]CAG0925232.1 unnamed protein product [Notodromas monacha]
MRLFLTVCVAALCTWAFARGDSDCLWIGHAPFCFGMCPAEYQEIAFASRDPGIGAFPGYSIETPFGRRCWTGSKKLCCNNEFFQTFNIDLRGNNATEKAPTTERDSRFLDDNNSRKEPPSFPRQPGNPNFGPEGREPPSFPRQPPGNPSFGNLGKESPSFPRQPSNPDYDNDGFGEIPNKSQIPGDITNPQRGLPPPGRQPNRFNPERPQGNYLPPRFPDN